MARLAVTTDSRKLKCASPSSTTLLSSQSTQASRLNPLPATIRVPPSALRAFLRIHACLLIMATRSVDLVLGIRGIGASVFDITKGAVLNLRASNELRYRDTGGGICCIAINYGNEFENSLLSE